jgi:hypothetical protein
MTATEPGERATVDESNVPVEPSTEATVLGARLDENHTPETNGWMAVCRRCGFRTEGPEGRHAPHALQVSAAESWLDHDALGSSIARLRSRRDT